MKSRNQVALGRAIRAQRHKTALSQEAFADKAGLHRTYMGSIERGERNVSLENIIVIARTLGMRAAELLKKAGL